MIEQLIQMLLGGWLGQRAAGATPTPTAMPTPTTMPTPTAMPTPTSLPTADRMTYYLPTGNQTSTGTDPTHGRTMAVSPDMLANLPYGSLVEVNGQTYRVEDQTNPRLSSTMDVYYDVAPTGVPGLQKDVPYRRVGEDYSGMRYKIPRR